MKDGAVVPDIVDMTCKLDLRDVTSEPRYARCLIAESSLRCRQSSLRQAQDGDLLVTVGEQIVNQRRGATANVDDARTLGHTCVRNEIT